MGRMGEKVAGIRSINGRYKIDKGRLRLVWVKISIYILKKVEMGMTPLIITPSDLLAKCLLPTPENLGSASLKVLVPEGEMFLPGDMIPLSWKLRVPSGHLGLLNRPLCLNQQAKKEVTVLGGVIDLD